MKQDARNSLEDMRKYGIFHSKYDRRIAIIRSDAMPQNLLTTFLVAKKRIDPTKSDFRNQNPPSNCSCPAIFVTMSFPCSRKSAVEYSIEVFPKKPYSSL
jgi:hypothetical protein